MPWPVEHSGTIGLNDNKVTEDHRMSQLIHITCMQSCVSCAHGVILVNGVRDYVSD